MLEILLERTSGSLHIALLWESAANELRVRVCDRATGDSFIVAPDAQHALEAFYHPTLGGTP